MTDRPPRGESDRKPGQPWDYSSHPLRDGGMQIVAVVVGSVVALVLLTALMVAAWLWMGPHSAGPPR